MFLVIASKLLNKLWSVTLAVHLFQHKKTAFMAYLVGKLIESIASDGLTGSEHYQCSHCWFRGVLQTGKFKLSTWEIFVLRFAWVVNAVNSFIKLGDSQLFRVSDERRNGIYAKNNKRELRMSLLKRLLLASFSFLSTWIKKHLFKAIPLYWQSCPWATSTW